MSGFGNTDPDSTSIGVARSDLQELLRQHLEAEGVDLGVPERWSGRTDRRGVFVFFENATADPRTPRGWHVTFSLELNLGQAPGAASESLDKYIDTLARFADNHLYNASITVGVYTQGGLSKATGSERSALVLTGTRTVIY